MTNRNQITINHTQEVEVEVDINIDIECECGETLDFDANESGDDEVGITVEPHRCKGNGDPELQDVIDLCDDLNDADRKHLANKCFAPELKVELATEWIQTHFSPELKSNLATEWASKNFALLLATLQAIMETTQGALNVAAGTPYEPPTPKSPESGS